MGICWFSPTCSDDPKWLTRLVVSKSHKPFRKSKVYLEQISQILKWKGSPPLKIIGSLTIMLWWAKKRASIYPDLIKMDHYGTVRQIPTCWRFILGDGDQSTATFPRLWEPYLDQRLHLLQCSHKLGHANFDQEKHVISSWWYIPVYPHKMSVFHVVPSSVLPKSPGFVRQASPVQVPCSHCAVARQSLPFLMGKSTISMAVFNRYYSC